MVHGVESQAMVELPRYKSHKVVHALKIHAIDLDLESDRVTVILIRMLPLT